MLLALLSLLLEETAEIACLLCVHEQYLAKGEVTGQ